MRKTFSLDQSIQKSFFFRKELFSFTLQIATCSELSYNISTMGVCSNYNFCLVIHLTYTVFEQISIQLTVQIKSIVVLNRNA